jgi:hypothetical protein
MRIGILLLCAVLLLTFLGCAPEKGDYFLPFRGEFTAQIAGKWQSLDFEAELAASAPDESGARVMTLTFYAPATLSGTVVKREATGEMSLAVDDLSLGLCEAATARYGALLDLFPITGEIHTVTKENGNTRLDGAGFSLLFAPDGTPLAVENAVASVEIKAWGTR